MGAATVKRLRATEARVAILDRDVQRGAALARETGCTFVEVDVTDEASVMHAFAQARSTIGQERILVHTPGGGGAGHSVQRDRAGTIVRHSFERFERIIRLNLNASFLCASVSAEGMMTLDPASDGGRGVIILTSSVASQDAQPGVAAYVAAKAAVNALTVAMARELAPEMIRVNAILPGTFDSPLIAGLAAEFKEALLAATGHPKRFGNIDEYGSLALEFIRNEYLNGALVRLDGVARL